MREYKSNQVNFVLPDDIRECVDNLINDGEYTSRPQAVIDMLSKFISPIQIEGEADKPSPSDIIGNLKDVFAQIIPKERVMIFVDVKNVIAPYGDIDYGTAHIDFKEMIDILVNGRSLVGSYGFDNRFVKDCLDQSKKFHTALEFQGLRMVLRDTYDTNKQHGIDVSMAIEMYKHAVFDHYDTAILVSGDKDFAPALEAVQDLGKRVEVAAPVTIAASEMIRKANCFHDLSEMCLLRMVGSDESKAVNADDSKKPADAQNKAEAC